MKRTNQIRKRNITGTRRQHVVSRRFPERRAEPSELRPEPYPEFRGLPESRQPRQWGRSEFDPATALRWIFGLGIGAVGAAVLIALVIANA